MNEQITRSNFRFRIFEPPKIFQISVNLQLQIYSLDIKTKTSSTLTNIDYTPA